MPHVVRSVHVPVSIATLLAPVFVPCVSIRVLVSEIIGVLYQR
jgi:hypothetical protein